MSECGVLDLYGDKGAHVPFFIVPLQVRGLAHRLWLHLTVGLRKLVFHGNVGIRQVLRLLSAHARRLQFSFYEIPKIEEEMGAKVSQRAAQKVH